MGVLTTGPACVWRIAPFAAMLAAMLALPGTAQAQVDSSSDTALKAAFLFNFAKFTEWPSLPPGAPLALCVAGDDRIAGALVDTVRGQRVGDHPLVVRAVALGEPVQSCHVLFVSQSETRSAKPILDGLKRLPILTVSDGRGFARSDGIIEFVVERERMRFVINPDAAVRAGLRLSSRLLGLARIVGNDNGS